MAVRERLPAGLRPWFDRGAQAALLAGLRVTRDPLARLLFGPAALADPYEVYDSIRATGDLVPSRLPGAWVAVGHEVVQTALREMQVGPPEDARELTWDSPLSPSLLDLNPPDHTRIRRLVAQAFTPKAIAQLRDRAQEVADQLLDAAAERGTIDLIGEYAAVLPVTMICQMLGIPADDIDRFRAWGADVAVSLEFHGAAQQRRIEQAGRELEAYFAEHLAQRRGSGADDVLAGLVAAREEDDHLSPKELSATCILLLVAGFETTVNLIGNGTLALLRDPAQHDLLADDPDTVAPMAVNELLRFDSPVQLTSRILHQGSVELNGVTLSRGASVTCLLGGANRDPKVFDKPNDLDLLRPNAKDHLSFSSGIHYCLGAPLARLEGEVALATLFRRFPALRQHAPARRRMTRVLRGLETFPVELRG